MNGNAWHCRAPDDCLPGRLQLVSGIEQIQHSLAPPVTVGCGQSQDGESARSLPVGFEGQPCLNLDSDGVAGMEDRHG